MEILKQPISTDSVCNNIKKVLIKKGFIFMSDERETGTTITVYENEEEFDYKQAFVKKYSDSYEESLRQCLQDMKDYYAIPDNG